MSKKIKVTIAVAALLAVLTAGVVYAYLTYTAQLTNTFTVGNVSATLTEPKWDAVLASDSDAHYSIYPGQSFAKDPTITMSDTSSPAVVFLEVSYPYQSVVTIGNDGKKLAAADTQLFTPGALNTGWMELDSLAAADSTKHTITRIYAYNKELAAKQSATLFDTVTFANIAEGTGLSELKIVVKADIIQAGGMTKAGETYTEAELGDIYGKFVAQNTPAK